MICITANYSNRVWTMLLATELVRKRQISLKASIWFNMVVTVTTDFGHMFVKSQIIVQTTPRLRTELYTLISHPTMQMTGSFGNLYDCCRVERTTASDLFPLSSQHSTASEHRSMMATSSEKLAVEIPQYSCVSSTY